MAIVHAARAESLRDQRVEPEQQAAAEQSHGDAQRVAQADGADSHRAIGQATDHHGVYDAHEAPAQLGQYQRPRQAQHGADFLAHGLETVLHEHERKQRNTEAQWPAAGAA